jgi:cytochrome c oxidase cbb3-type subunit III
MDGYKDEILDHNYDGIQEYDNPMPAWWSTIFVITVIWAGFYVAAIELGYIARYEENLKEGTEEIVAMRRAYEATQPKLVVDEQMLLAASQDVDQVSQGAELFASNCASCHGNQGQGMVGPNLTDDHWIHGVKMTQIHEILVKGVAEAGMPAWASIMTPEEIVATTAYVASIHGTDPEGAKSPQGEEYAMGPAEALEQEEQAAEGVETNETGDGGAQNAPDAEEGLDEVIQKTPGDAAVPEDVKVKPPMEGVGSDVAYPKDGPTGEDPDPDPEAPTP